MGRSSGGGGRSSGGFGGGRSSGGFSGGGRSSGGSFRNHSSSRSFSHSSGFGHGPRPRPRPPRMGPYIHHRRYGYGGYGYRSGYATIIAYLIIIVIVVAYLSYITNGTSNNIAKSTKERVALSGVANKTEWYNDQLGWISSKSVLVSGLEDFYKQTGIQPYILLVPYSSQYWNGSTINVTAADNYLESVYNSNFSDEAHFIFAYFSCKNDSKAEMEGEFRYLSGYSADTIMDNEAISILWGYFEKNYYDTSLSIEKMISNTFSETANAIMSKPTNFWDFSKIGVVAIVIIVIIVFIYKSKKNKDKREKEKEDYTKEILSKPLETFGNDTSDLEDKYK